MLARVRAAIPPALVVAFAVALIGDTAVSLYQAHLRSTHDYAAARGDFAALSLAGIALWLTVTLLIALGFGELAGRLRGGARALMTVATAVAALALVRPVIAVYATYVDAPSPSWNHAYYLWGGRATCALWLLGAGCMGAIVARQGARGIAVAAALMLATLINHPLQTIGGWLYFDHGHRWANALLGTTYHWAYVAALAGAAYLIGREAPAVPAEPVRIIDGLERVGTALVARVVLAIGVATFTMMAIGARSPGLGKLLVTVAPVALLATAIAQVSGLFAAARDGAGPRLRLAGAGALTLMAMTASACQAIAVYRLARDGWRRGEMDSWDRDQLAAVATALPYLVPLVGLAGLLLLLSAIASVRARRPTMTAASPGTAAAWLVCGTLAAIYLQHYTITHIRGAGTFVAFTLVVAAANVIATIAVARCCHQTAWAFRTLDPDALPAARVVDRNPM